MLWLLGILVELYTARLVVVRVKVLIGADPQLVVEATHTVVNMELPVPTWAVKVAASLILLVEWEVRAVNLIPFLMVVLVDKWLPVLALIHF